MDLTRSVIFGFVATATLSLCTSSLAAAPANTAAIADAQAKAAVEQINTLLSKIKEYTCTVETRGTTPKGGLSMIEQVWAKPPLLLNVQANTEHPAAIMRGNTTFYYHDGRTLTMHTKPGAGAVAAYTEMYSKGGKVTPAQAQQMAQQSAQAKATFVDLAKLQAANVQTDGMFYQEWITNPLGVLDMATLKLQAETADDWTFQGTAIKVPALIKIGKKDGIVRQVEMGDASMKQNITIRDVKLNPVPGIPETTFKYTPPPGIVPKDVTMMYLKR